MLQELPSHSSVGPRGGRFAEAGFGCVPGQRHPTRTRLPLPLPREAPGMPSSHWSIFPCREHRERSPGLGTVTIS